MAPERPCHALHRPLDAAPLAGPPPTRPAPVPPHEGHGRHRPDGKEGHGGADRQQHAEVADHRHARQPQGEEPDHRGDHGDAERRPEPADRAPEGIAVGLGGLLLVAAVQLDGEIDAEADEDGQPGDGDHRERDAQVADHREPRRDPHRRHGEGEQPPACPQYEEQDHRHHHHGHQPGRGDVAAHAVVDLGEERCGSGDRHREAVEALPGSKLGHRRRRGGLFVDGGVPEQADDHQGVAGIGECAPQRRADLALFVEEQELDEARVGQGVLAGRRQPGGVGRDPRAEGLLQVVARPRDGSLLGGEIGSVGRRFRPRLVGRPSLLAPERLRLQDRGDLELIGCVFEIHDRGDDRVVPAGACQTLLQRIELGAVLGRDEVGDGAFEEQDHHLAAEALLIADVVAIHVRRRVDHRVLARRELEPTQARDQRHGHGHQPERHKAEVPAEPSGGRHSADPAVLGVMHMRVPPRNRTLAPSDSRQQRPSALAGRVSERDG
jgi:hypothetical protein